MSSTEETTINTVYGTKASNKGLADKRIFMDDSGELFDQCGEPISEMSDYPYLSTFSAFR